MADSVPDDERERLVERIITAEQDERRRLALFLHDGPVQNLAGIALMLDAAVHAIDDGRPEAAREIMASRARAPPRDDPLAARPLVQHRAGRAPRPGLRRGGRGAREPARDGARACRSTSTSTRRSALGEKEQVGLYQIVRESLNQAVRRGPPSKISVTIQRDDRRADRDDRRRQRHGRAAHGRARRDRRARLDAERPLLGRAGRRRRDGDPRRPPGLLRSSDTD